MQGLLQLLGDPLEIQMFDLGHDLVHACQNLLALRGLRRDDRVRGLHSRGGGQNRGFRASPVELDKDDPGDPGGSKLGHDILARFHIEVDFHDHLDQLAVRGDPDALNLSDVHPTVFHAGIDLKALDRLVEIGHEQRPLFKIGRRADPDDGRDADHQPDRHEKTDHETRISSGHCFTPFSSTHLPGKENSGLADRWISPAVLSEIPLQ